MLYTNKQKQSGVYSWASMEMWFCKYIWSQIWKFTKLSSSHNMPQLLQDIWWMNVASIMYTTDNYRNSLQYKF